jgi:hypothetical protein
MELHNVGKILGCILLREPDEDETVQLAYGNDAIMHGNINNAKATLGAMYARCSAQHHHQQISTAHRAARRCRRVPHQVPQSPSQPT